MSPIRRWHGWQAVCPDCKEPVLLCGEYTAFQTRDEVKESLDIIPGQTIEEAIRECCGCRYHPTPPGAEK